MDLNEKERLDNSNLAEKRPQELTKSLAEDNYNIRLYEEKLKVDRRKQKIGEVIISKKIETRMVQIPLRQEKLIVERVGKHPERLAEIVIGEEKVNGFKFSEMAENNTIHSTKTHFISVETAEELLANIHYASTTANTKVRLEIVTNSAQQQIEQQAICEQYVDSQVTNSK